MIDVFIDESGNLGRGGRFFTIAAIAFKDDSNGKERIKRLMKNSCKKFSNTNTPLPEIKCNELSFPQKQSLLNKITTRPDCEIFYITAQKEHVSLLNQGRDKNLVYNYLAGMLCVKIAKTYNDDIQLNFDQRSTRVASMNSLKDYVRTTVYTKVPSQNAINVAQFDSRTMYNLQAADILAGSINSSYILNNKHLINIIKPRIESVIEFPHREFSPKLY